MVSSSNTDTYRFLLDFQAWVKRRTTPWPEDDPFLETSNDPIVKLAQVIEQERPKQWVLVTIALIGSFLALAASVVALVRFRVGSTHLGWNLIGYGIAFLFVSISLRFFVYYLQSRDIPTRYQLLAIASLQLFWDAWESVDARMIGPLLEAFAFWYPSPWMPWGFKDPTIMMMLTRILPLLDCQAYARLRRKQRWIFLFLLRAIWEGRSRWERQDESWWDAQDNIHRDLFYAVIISAFSAGSQANLLSRNSPR